jgi:hypothetical protein
VLGGVVDRRYQTIVAVQQQLSQIPVIHYQDPATRM